MGGSYEYLMLLETSADAAALELADHEGWTAAEGDTVVLFLRNDELFDPAFPRSISEAIDALTLRFSVYDDHILWCEVWRQGRWIAEVAEPDWAEYMGLDIEELSELDQLAEDSGVGAAEARGAEAFVDAVGRGDREAALEVFTTPHSTHLELQRALLTALDLPTFAVGMDFGMLRARPESYDGPELVPVGQ